MYDSFSRLTTNGAGFVELSTMPENPGPDEELNLETTDPFTIRVALTPYDTTLT